MTKQPTTPPLAPTRTLAAPTCVDRCDLILAEGGFQLPLQPFHSMVHCLQAFVTPAGGVLHTSRGRRMLPRTCLPSGPASRLRGRPGGYGPRIPLTRRAYVAGLDAGLFSGLFVAEAGISVIATMAHQLQSVSTEAAEMEKELEELQMDMKALLVELQGAAVQQADSGRGPKPLNRTGSDQAAVERAWKRTLARVARLQKVKSFVIGRLRELYKELDKTLHAMSTSEMMACDMRSVSTQIMEKESQRKAVREQLNAAASERDDEDPALVPLYQSEWDKARVLRQDEVFYVVDECLGEDQEYIMDVLEILYRMQNTLETHERTQLLFTGPSPLHAEPVTEVARRLPHFIAPNPLFGTGLFQRRFGVNPVPAAVRELHAFRTDARGTGYVMGSPGRGKTLFLLLLLLSIVGEPDLVMSLTRAMRDWWRSLPVYVLSFNGITKATADDHVLAWIDNRLPHLVRIIFAESWDPTATRNTFDMYRDHVLKLLTEGRVSVAQVAAVATDLVQARLLPSSPDGMRGLLLVDELPRLSVAALSNDECEQLLARLQNLSSDKDVLQRLSVGGERAAGLVSSATGTAMTRPSAALEQLPPASQAAATTTTAEAEATTAAAAISAAKTATTSDAESTSLTGEKKAAGLAAATIADAVRRDLEKRITSAEEDKTSLPEDAVMVTAEAVRKAICDWCEALRIRPVMTAFNERFVERQAGARTGSLSTVKEVARIPLLPVEEVQDQQRRRLLDLRVALRSSTAAGQRRLLPVGTVARHLALLTLGHPRASIVLNGAVEASSDGDHFFSILTDALAPSRLSVAQQSVYILAQHPLVMAVGLLNYDAPSSGVFTKELSWNTVFGEGALMQRPSRRSKTRNPTIIVTFFLAALEARVQMGLASAVVGSGAAAHDVLPASDKYGGWSEPERLVVADPDVEGEEDFHEDSVVATVFDISGDDGGVYAACNEVRRALLVGDVPVAWENLFLWTEVLLSCCRALLCRNQAALLAPGPLPYRKYSLRKLYPAPDRLTGQARWLSQATMDASIACRGVVYFSSIPQLLQDYSHEDLLGHVWRPWSSTFPGIDGITFLRCVRGSKGGPRSGELVARAEQYKSGERLVPNEDISQSCSSLRGLFGPELWKQWERRTALIITTRSRAPAKLDLRSHKPAFAIESVIVVDVDSIDQAYGNTIATFAVCADSLFGTHVVSRPSLGQPPKKRRRRAST
ncbi:hypothetical protein I4F81_007053 [Pyropia yezoensis]|uniref:Uncharacterized protein n=1 Tax=Pyropia yezoensis TaxID=2788 RepID=A0ACC3C3X6_PYRYE|nr:hypothetical protein I4F81_007053 [Neopyropia yezoensis]